MLSKVTHQLQIEVNVFLIILTARRRIGRRLPRVREIRASSESFA
jgi:hypothetical protein